VLGAGVLEISIRVTLGATKDDVFRMVIGQSLRLVLAGLALGVVAVCILLVAVALLPVIFRRAAPPVLIRSTPCGSNSSSRLAHA
jgi:ABC-type lipoprotein release transport system permease subunit